MRTFFVLRSQIKIRVIKLPFRVTACFTACYEKKSCHLFSYNDTPFNTAANDAFDFKLGAQCTGN